MRAQHVAGLCSLQKTLPCIRIYGTAPVPVRAADRSVGCPLPEAWYFRTEVLNRNKNSHISDVDPRN